MILMLTPSVRFFRWNSFAKATKWRKDRRKRRSERVERKKKKATKRREHKRDLNKSPNLLGILLSFPPISFFSFFV